MKTLSEEVAVYWLEILKGLAENSEQLKSRGQELPPEFIRVRNRAIRNYANSGMFNTFRNLQQAKNFCADLVAENRQVLTIVRLFKIGSDIYPSWAGGVGKIVTQSEYVVYPGEEMPVPPPGIYVGEPIQYKGDS